MFVAPWETFSKTQPNGSKEAQRCVRPRPLPPCLPQTPLHLAARNNQLGAMEALLSLGARPELKNSAGQTVADICVGEGAKDLVEQFDAKKRQKEQQLREQRGAGGDSEAGMGGGLGDVARRGAAGGRLVVSKVTSVSKAPEMPKFRPKADAR